MRRTIAWLMGLVGTTLPLAAAWSADLPELEEVVVTAQKRAERIQDVPMSISAFRGEKLQDAQVRTVADLPTIASGVTGTAPSSAQPLIAIRGLSSNDYGIGGDPALGIYVDEVYAGRSAGAVREVLDLERVEVLKGPQGTLFGRNTTAGAINFVTAQPTPEFSALASAFAGNRSAWGASSFVNGAVSDSVAARAAFSYRRADGDRRNVLDGRLMGAIDRLAGRVAGRYTAAGGSTWTISLDGERDRDDGPGGRNLTLPLPGDPNPGARTGPVASDLGRAAHSNRDLWGVTVRGEVPVRGLTLTSISAVRGYKVDYLEDTDASSLRQLNFGSDERDVGISQELRLSGQSGALTWFAGVGAFIENVSVRATANYDEDAICTGLAQSPVPVTCDLVFGGEGTIVGAVDQIERTRADGRYRAYAAFGDVRWELSSRDALTLGARVTHDRKQFEINTPAIENLLTTVTGDNLFLVTGAESTSKSWTAPTARLVFDHRFGNGTLGYASASHGYKSGGFNGFQATGRAFDPEYVNSFEVGVKSGRASPVTFDAAGFYYRYRDLQVQVFEGGLSVVRNAGTATGYGVDLNASAALGAGFTWEGFATWLSATYDRFSPAPGIDYAGNRLSRAPKYTAGSTLSFLHSTAGGVGFFARLGYVYQARLYFSPDNDPRLAQGGYGLIDAAAGFKSASGRYEITLRGKNLGDVDYVTHGQSISSINLANLTLGARRTIALEATASW